MVEHNIIPYLEQYGHQKYVDQNRSFTLAGKYKIPMFNPHYFGDFEITSKSSETIFVAIINHKHNKELLFNSCRDLIKENITNFKVIIAGRNAVNEIPPDLEKNIFLKGEVEFKSLWEIYNNSDFVIPMLNPEIGAHDRYKDGTITGTWQLILGFLKPALIHKQFAEFYKLNNENSLILNSNSDLSKMMAIAINMNRVKYELLQKNIKLLSDNVYNKSLENLKYSIEQSKNYDS